MLSVGIERVGMILYNIFYFTGIFFMLLLLLIIDYQGADNNQKKELRKD